MVKYSEEGWLSVADWLGGIMVHTDEARVGTRKYSYDELYEDLEELLKRFTDSAEGNPSISWEV